MPLVDSAWYVDGSTGIQVTDLGTSNNAAGATLTLAGITVPANSLIVVVTNEAVATTDGTLSDGGTNTYAKAAAVTESTSAGRAIVWYIYNCAALNNATLTFTKAGTGHVAAMTAFYATGVQISPDPRDTAFQNSSAVNSATPTVTSNAPTAAGELVVAVCAYSNAVAKTYTQDSTHNFNVPISATNAQGTASLGGGHLNVGGSLAVTFAPTLSGASDNACILLAFAAASAPVGWWNVTRWAASHTQHAGDVVRQNAQPAIGNERCFVCYSSTSGTGTTGSSEPNWSVGRGNSIADNTVTWLECTGVAALNGDYGKALTGTTNGITAAGSAILHFASAPVVPIGARVNDQTAITVIPANATVVARDATTITLSANVTGAGVGSADVIGFSNCPRWFDVKSTTVNAGQVVQSGDGTKILLCTTGGAAGTGAEPTWATYTNAGATTVDNAATWRTIAAVPSGFAAWAAPHARLANAFAANWGQNGNAFYVSNHHAEAQASAMTLNSGAIGTPSFTYCVDDSVALPPATLATTATITTTGSSLMTINGAAGSNDGYFYGITFSEGSGAVSSNLAIGASSANSGAVFENCKFVIGGSSGGTLLVEQSPGFSNRIKFKNTTVQFNAAGSGMACFASDFVWEATASAIVSGTLPTKLFLGSQGSAYNAILRGVDLSALGSGKTIVGAGGVGSTVKLIDCKLGASVTVAGTPTVPGCVIDLIRGDSGATNYRDERYKYEGTQTAETAIVRTGGATDGATPVSWKLVTTANSKWSFPFESQPIAIWNDVAGSPITVTMYGIWGGAAVPNTDDVWIEAEYLADSGDPLGGFVNSTKANNLAAGVALTADGSTWGGSTTAFSMSVTFTPQQKGPINLVVKAAKASSTFYVDPRPVITGGPPVRRSEIVAPGVYISEISNMILGDMVGGCAG